MENNLDTSTHGTSANSNKLEEAINSETEQDQLLSGNPSLLEENICNHTNDLSNNQNGQGHSPIDVTAFGEEVFTPDQSSKPREQGQVGQGLASRQHTLTSQMSQEEAVEAGLRVTEDDPIATGKRVPSKRGSQSSLKMPPSRQSSSLDERWPDLIVSRMLSSSSLSINSSQGSYNHSSLSWSIARSNAFSIERKNLVNLLKLVIKELIETSNRMNRNLESDYPPLNHFFVIMEHILRHGFQPRRSYLSGKKDIFDMLELVDRATRDGNNTCASIKDIPTIKSSLGRTRAWIRLCLMQKNLADQFKALIDRKEIVNQFYDEHALLRSDAEAQMVSGLIVGLNTIDANLCLKDMDLDHSHLVIDLDYYLRDNIKEHKHEALFGNNADADESSPTSTSSGYISNGSNIQKVLDQKNYIEELNKHLTATNTNLQRKLEQLESRNKQLQEDLDIAKDHITKLKSENSLLRDLKSVEASFWGERRKQSKPEPVEEGEKSPKDAGSESSDGESGSYEKVKKSAIEAQMVTDIKRLEEEKMSLERELELTKGLKYESDTALKLLEKDIHEKQDTIISLRQQLEDIKAINLEMFNKLKECESLINTKNEHIIHIEGKVSAMAKTIANLESKLATSEKKRRHAEENQEKLRHLQDEANRRILKLETDLREQRERYVSMQGLLDGHQRKLVSKEAELENLKKNFAEQEDLQRHVRELERRCQDYELSLEEIGAQLRDAKLEAEELREKSHQMKEAKWTDDAEVAECRQCNKPFSVSRRKHHCRNCGDIFCGSCSDNKMPLPSSAKPVRVCDACHTRLLERFSTS